MKWLRRKKIYWNKWNTIFLAVKKWRKKNKKLQYKSNTGALNNPPSISIRVIFSLWLLHWRNGAWQPWIFLMANSNTLRLPIASPVHSFNKSPLMHLKVLYAFILKFVTKLQFNSMLVFVRNASAFFRSFGNPTPFPSFRAIKTHNLLLIPEKGTFFFLHSIK